MKYWVAYDSKDQEDRIVAFHEDKNVVQEYIDSVIGATYELGRCKSSELKRIDNIGDLYLVRHLDTYVQCKFYECLLESAEEEVYELRKASSVLERILRLNEPDTSTTKAIIKTIAYLKKLVLETEGTVPGYDSAQREYDEVQFQKEKLALEDMTDLESTDQYLYQ